jgi:sulfite dehydrogenase (quinone) subunit SoeA
MTPNGDIEISRRNFLKAIGVVTGGVMLSPGGDIFETVVGTAEAANPEPTVQVVKGRCYECHVQCFVEVLVRDGRVLKVQGDQTPNNPRIVNEGALCAKGQASVKNLYSPERLNYPLKRTRPKGEADPGWVRISWDEALGTIATKVAEVKGKYGAHSVAVGQGTGRFANEFVSRLGNSIGTPITSTRHMSVAGPGLRSVS